MIPPETGSDTNERLLRQVSEHSARVLIVEDEALIAADVQALLMENGFAVVGPADTTGEAISLLDSERCDLAVVDLSLKGELGWSVVEALIARKIPYLLISAVETSEIPAMMAGVKRLSKPFLPGDLVAGCRELIPAR